jgi:hypothetical protein
MVKNILINFHFCRIIKNKDRFPGRHLESCERTTPSFKPLEPKSQLLVIWRATCEYIKEQFCKYKGINIRGFGAFTYEVKQTLPRLGIDFNQAKTKTFEELLLEKKSRHIMRPCFVIDPRFLPILTRFNNKEELTKPKSQSSIYQKGINMTYCNPIPIAAGCCLDPRVVEDGLKAIFNAVYILISIGQNVFLKTGFCNINFVNRDLTYSFSPEILNMVKDLPSSEAKFIRGITPINKTWRTSFTSKWANSTLSTMLERPRCDLIKTIDNKSQMLKIMSLDMASTYTNGFNHKNKLGP